jgi:hypothetical protein
VALRLKSGESVRAAVQRTAREQIDKSIGEIEDRDLERAWHVRGRARGEGKNRQERLEELPYRPAR